MTRSARPRSLSSKSKRPPRCPICGKPREPAFRPFCSARCRDVDLARWLEGAYAVPAIETDEDGSEDQS